MPPSSEEQALGYTQYPMNILSISIPDSLMTDLQESKAAWTWGLIFPEMKNMYVELQVVHRTSGPN